VLKAFSSSWTLKPEKLSSYVHLNDCCFFYLTFEHWLLRLTIAIDTYEFYGFSWSMLFILLIPYRYRNITSMSAKTSSKSASISYWSFYLAYKVYVLEYEIKSWDFAIKSTPTNLGRVYLAGSSKLILIITDFGVDTVKFDNLSFFNREIAIDLYPGIHIRLNTV
jgi:hypothetical protein